MTSPSTEAASPAPSPRPRTRRLAAALVALGALLAPAAKAQEPLPVGGHVQIYSYDRSGLLVDVTVDGRAVRPARKDVQAALDGLSICFEATPRTEQTEAGPVTRFGYFVRPTRDGVVSAGPLVLTLETGARVRIEGRPEDALDDGAGRPAGAATFRVDPTRVAVAPRLECTDLDLDSLDWDGIFAIQRDIWRTEEARRPVRCEGAPRLERVQVVHDDGTLVSEVRTQDVFFLQAILSGDAGGELERLSVADTRGFALPEKGAHAGAGEQAAGPGRCGHLYRWRLVAPAPGTVRAPTVRLRSADGLRTEALRGPVLKVSGPALEGVPGARGMVSLYGGRSLAAQAEGAYEHGLRGTVGWPGLEVGYLRSLARDVDLVPLLRLRWAQRVTETGVLGLEAGAEGRWMLRDATRGSLAVVADPTFGTVTRTDGRGGSYGLSVGVGLVSGWQVAPDLALSLGGRVRPSAFGGGDFVFRLPVYAEGALEWELTRYASSALSLVARLTAGIDPCLAGCDDVDAWLEGGVGVAWSWRRSD